ncbi:CDC27 family protein [Mesonia aestuariivivens]|uniref:CDC27 family protein n=1 Tax=Mesonia aestuariivivens TaxID=2796128 RepID=A0ABS6W550_9FLAO|nr:CDC27 family protein [Mesonia aestuariivivens]MBW2962248.1 CDC27 family protein [Mesonia aestuariivivens]
MYEVANYYNQKKQYENVEEIGRKALANYPENIKIISLLAKNALVQNKFFLAKNRFEQLLEFNKKTVFVHINLGNCYFNLKEYENAYQQFLRVLELDNTHHNAGLLAGKCLLMLERYQDAEQLLRTAVLLVDQAVDDYYMSYAIS